ncbi:hypothetical protein PHYC_03153 [Phycisphaerales bacterium]|nr:hypothetical protein PHYC_03153 [Phycisphaerales bacterium]
MPESESIFNLGIALGLGLLVGLQRERAGSAIAGIRTFAIITLLGAAAAMLTEPLGAWVVVAGFLSVAVLTLVGNLIRPVAEESPGVTTEAAMLLMYGVGAMVVLGPRIPAVMVGAACAILLQVKPVLQRLAKALSDADIKAIMQFAAMTLILLPIVPDVPMGPFDVLNPRSLWWMVVLVVGMSLLGYVAYRVFGGRRGTALAGILGGMISSTATTVSFSRRAKESPGSAGVCVLAIMLASCVLYVRVLVELWAAARTHFLAIAPAVGWLFLISVVIAGLAVMRARGQPATLAAQKNPSELRSALFFAALYAAVLVASAAAHRQFGTSGIYAVAAISGLTDMDAITLSSARMAMETTVTPPQASNAIVIAALSNTVFKTGVMAVIGGGALLRRVWWLIAIKLAAGSVILMW